MSVVTATQSEQYEHRFHWTVDAFYCAVAGGVFDEPKQWELVEGELWKKEPMNPPHADTSDAIAELLRANLPSRFRIREEKPVHLSASSEPVPDVAVIIARGRAYGARHPEPEDVVLLVEVADTSVEKDTGEKALLYAQAGIADYWVSAIRARELFVFRQPSDDGYREVLHLTGQDTIRPLVAPDVELSVRDLLFAVDDVEEVPVSSDSFP